MLYGIELGGTKVVCGAGTPDRIVDRARIPTTVPEETLTKVRAWMTEVTARHAPPTAVGIASFGPIERRVGHDRWGWITTTPKPDWDDTDVVGALDVDVPVSFETDVNGAALGEYRHGAGQGADTLVYLTIGTGVGGGLLVAGRPSPGLGHPEMGHVRPRRHPDDDFAGTCPFHGDCLEGLVSGTALAGRFGGSAESQPVERLLGAVVGPLADALADVVYVTAPERIIIGGGVGLLPGLHQRVETALIERMGDYAVRPEHRDGFVVPPGLGADAGLVGALCLAEAVAS